MEKQKLGVTDVLFAVVIALALSIVMGMFTGCASSSTACLDGYLYDKNEYGYELKYNDDKELIGC